MGLSYSCPATHLKAYQDEGVGSASTNLVSPKTLTSSEAETLRTLEGLAAINESNALFADAAVFRKQAVAICEENLGPNHSLTLKSLQDLAIVYERQGQFKNADTLYERVFSNPTIPQSIQATQYLERALEARSNSIGGEHPATLMMMAKLSRSYSNLGRPDEASRFLEKVFDARRRILGDGAPATLQSAEQLAESFTRMGEFEKAAKLEEMIMVVRRRSLGMKHHDTQLSLDNLASTYANVGRHKEAAELLDLVLRSRTDSIGNTHPATLQAKHRLAQIYRVMGRREVAAKLEAVTMLYLQSTIDKLHLGPTLSPEELQNPSRVNMASLEISSSVARQNIKVFSPVMSQWLEVLAVFDINTEKNWISTQAVRQIQLIPHYRKPIRYFNLNGENLESGRAIFEVLWSEGDGQLVRKTELQVVDAVQFEIVLGTDFVFSKAILELGKSSLLVETTSR